MDRHIRMSLIATAGYSIAICIVLLLTAGPKPAMGAAAGAAIALTNYYLLIRDITRITTANNPRPYRSVGIRFILIGILLFAMIALLRMSPVGMIIGVTMVIPGIVVGIVLGWKT